MATEVKLVTTARLGSNLSVNETTQNVDASTIVSSVGFNGGNYLKNSMDKLLPTENWLGSVNLYLRLLVTTRALLLSDFQAFDEGAGTFQIKAGTVLGTITGIEGLGVDFALPNIPLGGSSETTSNAVRYTFGRPTTDFPYVLFKLFDGTTEQDVPGVVQKFVVDMGPFVGSTLPSPIVTTANTLKFEIVSPSSGNIVVGGSPVTVSNQLASGLLGFADLANPVQSDVDNLNSFHDRLYGQSGMPQTPAPAEITVFGVSHTLRYDVNPDEIVVQPAGPSN